MCRAAAPSRSLRRTALAACHRVGWRLRQRQRRPAARAARRHGARACAPARAGLLPRTTVSEGGVLPARKVLPRAHTAVTPTRAAVLVPCSHQAACTASEREQAASPSGAAHRAARWNFCRTRSAANPSGFQPPNQPDGRRGDSRPAGDAARRRPAERPAQPHSGCARGIHSGRARRSRCEACTPVHCAAPAARGRCARRAWRGHGTGSLPCRSY